MSNVKNDAPTVIHASNTMGNSPCPGSSKFCPYTAATVPTTVSNAIVHGSSHGFCRMPKVMHKPCITDLLPLNPYTSRSIRPQPDGMSNDA